MHLHDIQSRLSDSALKPRASSLKPARAFTLVEMLVVISIIAVLAALLLPAVNRVLVSGRNTAIAVEINQLASAIESYKQDKGDYPPNFRDSAVVLRHIRKCYPKADPAYAENFVKYACGITNKTSFIDEGEALVFWLSMTDNDPRHPFLSYHVPSGGGTYTAAPKKYYDFEESRLAPYNTSEEQTVSSIGKFGDVRSHFNKYAKDSPFIYVDSRSYVDTCRFKASPYSEAADSYAYAEDSSSTTTAARPYWSLTTTGITTPNNNRTKYKPMNATTFQILCAGQDGDFGDLAGDVKGFPTADQYQEGDADNITNFSAGKTLKDNIPN